MTVRFLILIGTLLFTPGCAGVEVIPGVTSEEDVVMNVAYEHLLEAGAINGTYQVRGSVLPVRQDSFPIYPPPPPPQKPPWTEQWRVSFDVFDSFGNPVGELSVLVWRFDEAGETRYEVGT
ncbi:MAG: hypothetical protein ABJF88_03290 [Rhodothermales bacterium]